MLSHTVLFITPTFFGQSCEHLQVKATVRIQAIGYRIASILTVRHPEDGHKSDRSTSV